MTKLTLKGEAFDLTHGALATSRAIIAEKLEASTADERAFWTKRLAAYDALLDQFDKALLADTSQDAEPDAEDDC